MDYIMLFQIHYQFKENEVYNSVSKFIIKCYVQK